MTALLELRINAGYRNQRDVLRDFSLQIEENEILGLVGPSGEGKSTVALAILGLLGLKGGYCSGEIRFRGADLHEIKHFRGKQIALVPQSPIASLNPNVRIGAQLQEVWNAHEKGSRDFTELLNSVSLPATKAFLRAFPRNLSVGMAQRVLIAMAIMHRPALLIADEATSALDMITQAEILDLFARLNRELNLAILYISHDLASVARLCGRIAILHGGEIVECGETERIFERPRHAYTRKLISAGYTRFLARDAAEGLREAAADLD